MSDQVVASVNLFRNHERQTIEGPSSDTPDIPAIIISGFLGSGKTTLIRHILKNRLNLRFGILVNEVGEVDIDSQLVEAQQNNAALGVPSTNLAGGCVCCSVNDNLRQALTQLLHSSQGHHNYDYIIIETTGLADPAPIAATLSEVGVRLESAVIVVDVEAVRDHLSLPVVKRQLSTADIILINKCDLVTLSEAADVEDLVETITGARALRCRFGQVAMDALLDIACTTSKYTLASAAGAGFVSHEPIVQERAAERKGLRRSALASKAVSSKRQRRDDPSAPPAPPPRSPPTGPAMPPLCSLDSDDMQVSTVALQSDAPLRLGAFQSWIVNHLIPAKGLLRAKGVMWFSEERLARFVFQSSGRQRAVCSMAGPWEGQARVQVVLIGQHRASLQRLKDALQMCVDSEGSTCSRSTLAGETAHEYRTTDDASTNLSGAGTSGSDERVEKRSSAHSNPVGDEGVDGDGGGIWSTGTTEEFCRPRDREMAAKNVQWRLRARFEDRLRNDERFEIKGPEVVMCPGQAYTSLVFGLRGSTHHGVSAEAMNGHLLRELNASRQVFACGIPATGSTLLHGNKAAQDECAAGVVIGFDGAMLEGQQGMEDNEIDRVWGAIDRIAAGVVKYAFRHVNKDCMCDVHRM